MSKFFINRPIVAMVISIVLVLVGALTILSLPVAQFPSIAPPEIQILATYVGADAQTLEQAVADERRGQHELHVFAERHRQFHDQPDRGL
jgi:multidrug efflux pump subunit AcrB